MNLCLGLGARQPATNRQSLRNGARQIMLLILQIPMHNPIVTSPSAAGLFYSIACTVLVTKWSRLKTWNLQMGFPSQVHLQVDKFIEARPPQPYAQVQDQLIALPLQATCLGSQMLSTTSIWEIDAVVFPAVVPFRNFGVRGKTESTEVLEGLPRGGRECHPAGAGRGPGGGGSPGHRPQQLAGREALRAGAGCAGDSPDISPFSLPSAHFLVAPIFLCHFEPLMFGPLGN